MLDAMLEAMNRFLRHVECRAYTDETELEVFEFLRGNDATHRQVHDQVKLAGQVTTDRCEDAFGAPLRPREDHEVARLALIAKPPGFQFFVQDIQMDAGETWGSGAALPRPPRPLFAVRPSRRLCPASACTLCYLLEENQCHLRVCLRHSRPKRS